MNRIVLIAAGMVLLFSGNLSAQQRDGVDREARKAAVKELRERLQEWAHAEIVPKLSEWKTTLDGAMSPEDLTVLNDLRVEAKELRKTIRKSLVGLRKAWREEDYEALKRYRAELSAARKRRIDIVDLLTPLAIEYRETLMEIGKDAKPHIRSWRQEGLEIWESWRSEHGAEVERGIGQWPKGGLFLGGLLDPETKKAMRVVRFMLWDGSHDVGGRADTDEPDLK